MESIYEKIRLLRTQHNMTLKDLSIKTGLSISFLSQVERGNSSLAITSLQKIGEALQVPITYFFEEPANDSYFLPEKERKRFQIGGSHVVYVRLGGDFPDRALEPIHITLPPQQQQEVAFNHPGEEFYFILEGKVVTVVDGKEHEMSKGDTIHFPSTLDHTWYNHSDEPAQILCVLTPVIFKN
ncbi:cupin domain-containing protein [Paenibacillus sp. SYP-B3998]|uniref:Cupin domain-containing protein n=1 Tax=Paenibacillus sp. SYP-B3998 TaxID=2678564 RepID=A0A6G4A5E9_9BACL|nr:XRE family transcriptional regulator [Paenibacillus sp. SYP-B3998]NEW09051.1 cupin domain-containing protein [Paenibacillus sp. SYP-B3998]